jgi:hypothetical protein
VVADKDWEPEAAWPIEVELSAYALPDDHQVFKCFPGEGYKFYDVVERESVAFLDIRGLDELPPNPAAWSDEELQKAIEWDLVTKGPSRRGRGKRRRRSGLIKRNENFVKGLLLEVRKGALIVVPPPGYRRDVLIGEVLDEPGHPARVEARDRDFTYIYLGRKVRWLARVEKRLLRRELLDRLHTAQAFFAVGDSMHEDVYSVAYENYVWRGNFVATFHTAKENFTSADNLISSIWFNGLAAVGQGVMAIAPDSFVDAALSGAGGPENQLELNINSPGTILVRSLGPFALAAMAMLPLSAGEAQQVADGQARITLKAVGGSDPACQIQVEAAVADYVRSLGPELLLEACEYGRKTREGATLRAKVHLKKPHKGHT